MEMNATEITIDQLYAANIVRVYSGKPGCGCGCRGRYWPEEDGMEPSANDVRQIARIRQIMAGRIRDAKSQDGTFFIEDDKRYYWAYTS